MEQCNNMKRIAKITYPYTVLNTILVDITNMTEDEVSHLQDNIHEQVDLIEDNVYEYECADVALCKAAREVDMYKFEIAEMTEEMLKALKQVEKYGTGE